MMEAGRPRPVGTGGTPVLYRPPILFREPSFTFLNLFSTPACPPPYNCSRNFHVLNTADRLLVLGLLFPALAAAECIPITEARLHVGEDQCVTGRVIRVKHSSGGVTSLSFCQDSMVCPFTVVVFPHDLRNVGDVNQLQDRVIEIHGPVKEYDGRTEIVLQRLRQLGGTGARIPPLPKNYDVENKGHYSAGKFSLPRAAHKTSKKRRTAKIPIAVPEDTEPD
jgi:hypothetical protein